MRLSISLAIFISIPFLLHSQNEFIVNSNADFSDVDLADLICADQNGNCTLRAAIENANKYPDVDVVKFNIPSSGPHLIKLSRNLPYITETVILDATTQPGYEPGRPQVVLNGKNVPLLNEQEKRIDDFNIPRGFWLIENSHGSTIAGFVLGEFGFVGYREGRKEQYFSGHAIEIDTNNNIIHSNFIGVNWDGVSSVPNTFGMIIQGKDNLIGSSNTEKRNIISGNWKSGILCYSYNRIIGNYIGTDYHGRKKLGQNIGINLIGHSRDNLIDSNLISGNLAGLLCQGDKNIVINNKVGTDVSGANPIPNQYGIQVEGKSNVIGKKSAGNLISGNEYGLFLYSYIHNQHDFNVVLSNLIGTDSSGNKGLPNRVGLSIRQSSYNYIGGENLADKNIISGNTDLGVHIWDALHNELKGNLIGLDRAGRIPLPNGIGVKIESLNEITQYNTLINNTISNNTKNDLILKSTNYNCIFSNYIGIASDLFPVGPKDHTGITISADSPNNYIGGAEMHLQNYIWLNNDDTFQFQTDNSLGTERILLELLSENQVYCPQPSLPKEIKQ